MQIYNILFFFRLLIFFHTFELETKIKRYEKINYGIIFVGSD